jgi:Transposase IS200 like
MLATKNVHDSFVAFGLRAAQSHNIAVGRYVIMPDHLHLFVCGDLYFHLGKWIKALKQALGKSISSAMRHDRIWQEGFSIIFYAVTKAWRRNGSICAIIPSVPDSLQFGRNGLSRGK